MGHFLYSFSMSNEANGRTEPLAASVNAAYLGEYLDRDSAMARVESDIEHAMEMVLFDWGLYLASKEGRRARTG